MKLVITGHPVGYSAKGRGKWGHPAWQRFIKYRDEFKKQTCGVTFPTIPKGQKVRCDVLAVYGRLHPRPDPDHVFSAVLDCLFENDKHVVGSVDYTLDRERPRVEILIDWNPEGGKDAKPSPA